MVDVVAQVSNLPCRGLPTRQPSGHSAAPGSSGALPIGNPRYSKCGNLRHGVAALALLAAFSFACRVGAAVPSLEHLHPVALQVGTTNPVAAIGKFDPWPPQVWMDAPGIVFKPETNSGKFSLEIAADTAVGPHLVRLFNEQGASGPRFLVVTQEPQAAEQEPNDEFTKPQRIENLPATLNGRLDKNGDVDSYAIALEAGQTLIASIEAYTLASPIDAVLRLLDSRGVEAAFNHDDGRTLDPSLEFTAKAPGTYVLQVFGFAFPATADVRFTGGNACVYRLHFSRGPTLRHTLPLGVQRGARTPLRLLAWNVGAAGAREWEFDASDLPPNCAFATVRPPGFENALELPVSDGPERTEREPNDSSAEANPLEVPGAVTGSIEKPGDEDRFLFTAKKGEQWVLEVQSASLGFPLDCWLKIEDPQGKELARADDGASADPRLEWAAPTDGSFVAAVGNVLHRGGGGCLFRLSATRPKPTLKAVVAANAFTIEPGTTNEVKLTVTRLHGFSAKLSASVQGLPDRVTMESVEVPDKSGDLTLKLIAATEARPFNGPFQIILTETETKQEHAAIAELVGSTVNNGVPGGFTKLLIESTDQLWLTVLPPPPQKVAETK